MKKKFFVGLTTIGMTAVLITGCTKLPQAEIDAANAAIEETRASGAEIYAPDNFFALEDSMSSVMVNIEAQKSRFFKNYSGSVEELAGVTQFAKEVTQETSTRKEIMKVEIQTTLAEVKDLIEANMNLISEAPKGKEGTSALVAIRSELQAIESTLNQANSLIEQGDFITTLDKAKIAKEKATAINLELTEVIAKYKANVRNSRI